ncbi:MAG TPA: type II toxin-antitoxin system HipA family toxin [Acidimicrobiia bacterium]
MAEELTVWLYGEPVATTDQERRRLRLIYSQDAHERYALGAPILSLALPLRDERYTHGVVQPFLDGLLPEGESRRVIADELNLKAADTFGLIRSLGRDCAGALVIQPSDATPPTQPTTLTAEPITDDEIADLVARLRVAPLGVNQRVRISLPGVQDKLLLTRMPDGRWGRPVDGTPSTHILKPEIRGFPMTVENEAFCMRVAKHLGLAVAPVETAIIGDWKLIVVERYDRIVSDDGSVERIHQEDFCQATAVAPDKKYEDDGGPSLQRIAGILQTAAIPGSVDDLLRAVTLNVLLGNGDAHAKNVSLLHERDGRLRLAPLYDLMSTLHYGLDRLAMHIDNVHRTNRVTAARILNEAEAWGMSRRRAGATVRDILDRLPAAVEAARDETPGVPAEIPTLVAGQIEQVRSDLDAATP